MLKVSYFPSKLSLIFIGFFKNRRAHPCMSILALVFLLTQKQSLRERPARLVPTSLTYPRISLYRTSHALFFNLWNLRDFPIPLHARDIPGHGNPLLKFSNYSVLFLKCRQCLFSSIRFPTCITAHLKTIEGERSQFNEPSSIA